MVDIPVKGAMTYPVKALLGAALLFHQVSELSRRKYHDGTFIYLGK